MLDIGCSPKFVGRALSVAFNKATAGSCLLQRAGAAQPHHQTAPARHPPIRVSSNSSIRVSELIPALGVVCGRILLLVGTSRCAVCVAVSGATCSVIQASRVGRFARLVRAGTSQRNVPTSFTHRVEWHDLGVMPRLQCSRDFFSVTDSANFFLWRSPGDLISCWRSQPCFSRIMQTLRFNPFRSWPERAFTKAEPDNHSTKGVPHGDH
jgi:hypothetical protein